MSQRFLIRMVMILSFICSAILMYSPTRADVVDHFKKGNIEGKRWRLEPLVPEFQASREPPVFLDELANQAAVLSSKIKNDKPELVVNVGHVNHWMYSSYGQAISPDGHYLVSGGYLDGVVKIWDIISGVCVRTIVAHTDRVTVVTFSPDGKLIVTGSDDRTVKIWTLASGELIRTIRVDPFAQIEFTARLMGEVKDIEVSPDGRFLALVIDDYVPRIIDLATGRELHNLVGHVDTMMSIAFHPDGQMVATGSDDGTVRIWDVHSGQEIKMLKSNGDGVWDICFSPDGRWIAANVYKLEGKSYVRVWKIENWKKSLDLSSLENIRNIAFSPESRGLVIAGRDEEEDGYYLKLFDATKGNVVWSRNEPQSVLDPVFSPDGRWLFTTGDRLVQWDAMTGEYVRTFGSQLDRPRTAMLAPKAGILATISGNNGSIDIWDLALGGIRQKISRDEEATGITISSDGRSLAIGNAKGRVFVQDLISGKVDLKIDAHDDQVSALGISQDGQWLASGSLNGSIKLWELNTGKHISTLHGHEENKIGELVFSADSRLLVSCGWDDTVRIWTVPTGELRQTLIHDEYVHSVVISPDGRWIASIQSFIDTGRQIKLWDVESGELINVLLEREIGWFGGLAFTPNSQQLAMGLNSGLIALWKIGTVANLSFLSGHSGQVNSISFTPDGTLMLSGSNDGTLKIWDIETYRPLATLVALPGSLDWIIATPDGLFDGSPSAWKQLAWRFGGSTFDVAPIELFFSEYYFPRLLTDIIEGRRPYASEDLAAKDRRQPDIKLTVAGLKPGESTTNRMVTVCVEVAEAPADEMHTRGSGARDLRLFRNGVRVKTWPDDLLAGETTSRFEVSIPLVSGENIFTAYAFNNDDIKSEDSSLIIKGDETLQRAGTLYILAVGINLYSNPAYNLNFALKDAETFAQGLTQSQQEVRIYENIEVFELTDERATKSAILGALARLAGMESEETVNFSSSDKVTANIGRFRKSQPEDGVILYFAGHGTAQQDRFYLLPHDLGYKGSMTEIDSDRLNILLQHGISDRELENAFSKIDAGRFLLVIDACNSGQALEAEEKRRGPMNSKGLAQLAYEKGMYVLTAAQSYQVAMETSELGHGFLTYALVEEGLKTDAADYEPEDGEVQLREWLDFTVVRVPEIHTEIIGQTSSSGRGLKIIENNDRRERVEQWKVQHPRVFYRRTPEAKPMVIVHP